MKPLATLCPALMRKKERKHTMHNIHHSVWHICNSVKVQLLCTIAQPIHASYQVCEQNPQAKSLFVELWSVASWFNYENNIRNKQNLIGTIHLPNRTVENYIL